MAEVVLFHHLRGRTDGVLAFADRLRAGGHVVHTPDLFAGALPDSNEEGFALSQKIGDEAIAERATADLPAAAVFAGISFGVLSAQRLAQTHSGARGALLYEACLPIHGEWAIGPWPPGVPVQIHGMDSDPFFALEGDVDAARDLVATIGEDQGQLFLYAGDRHLFTDSSLPSFDPAATDLAVERSLEFLGRLPF